ncbi:MAG: prolyl-tRNA synthetase [bacterium]|nr:prolyl-tRNA synthetase [bacterium]
MRQSELFTKTRKEAPKDEVAKNAKLLIRAGFVHKEMAGVYSYLPLGLRVLKKINNIIRREMDAIGGQELFLTALQDKSVWEKTNRWDDSVVDNWFKTKLKNGSELGLGFTHEEPLTKLMKEHISSFRDLPAYPYQIQTKFRNEIRAKSGIMRGREFLMKDLYSFSKDENEHNSFYEKAKGAYGKIFASVGLGDMTYITFASGGSFSKYSHEFQTICEAGEDIIFVSEEKKIAVNKEVYDDKTLEDLGLKKEELKEEKAIEVGNIFSLGTRFSEAFNLDYTDENGEKNPVVMGSYGIGPGRLMGAIVEIFSDEKGIVWPESVAPFGVHLLRLGGDSEVMSQADGVYADLQNAGMEVLYDDREGASAGEKFADSDLIGIPWRVVASAKTAAAGKLELKNRKTGEVKMADKKELLEEIANY